MTSQGWHIFRQDLTTDYPGLMGGYLRHGRCYLTRHGGRQEGLQVGAEWSFFRENSSGLSYEHDPTGDHKHSFRAAVNRVFQIFLHCTPPWKKLPDGARLSARKIGFQIHDGAVFWQVWKEPGRWSRSDGWRNSSWNWMNALFGKAVYESMPLREVETLVPMPEGNYPIRVTLKNDRWTRPRSVFGLGEHEVRRAEIDVLPGPNGEKFIPVPGKGENSWDLDDDGIYSMVCPAVTVSDAIAAMVESAMRTRERHGGLAWQP